MKKYINKKYIPHLVSLFFTMLVVGNIFKPGYTLLLDMAWTPELPLRWNINEINNDILLRAMLHYLSLIIPSYIIQKMFFVTMVFSLFYMPYKYIPYVNGYFARGFSAGVFALNPFVYARILSGQWMHLYAYALLPILMYSLIEFTKDANKKNASKLLISFVLISFFSIHFLYLSFLISFFWMCIYFLKYLYKKNSKEAFSLFKENIYIYSTFLIINIYWILPAFLRNNPLEKTFNTSYYSLFAAAGNQPTISTTLNVSALGGFWGEGALWKYYFYWPQQTLLFWVSMLTIWNLVCLGFYILYKNKNTRLSAFMLLFLSVISFITSLGASETPFKDFNLFLYDNMPMWSGMRDSNKISGILALMYSILSGIGVGYLFTKLEKTISKKVLFTCLLLVLIFFGSRMWLGISSQIEPVNYPNDWYEAKIIIDKLPKEEKVLILPWHQYLSLSFNKNKVVGSPAENFFGGDKVVMSHSVDFNSIHDQETNLKYRELDELMQSTTKKLSDTDREKIKNGLKKYNITYILYMINEDMPNSEKGLTYWEQFSEIQISNVKMIKTMNTWQEILGKTAEINFAENTLTLKSVR